MLNHFHPKSVVSLKVILFIIIIKQIHPTFLLWNTISPYISEVNPPVRNQKIHGGLNCPVCRSFYLMTGLSVQAGGGDVTGPVMAAGGQQDEVTWERLILPHHHDVPHLTE